MRIVFMGTPAFAVPTLKALKHAGHDIVLAVTQPDRPAGRKKVMTPPPVKTAALELSVPVIQPEKLSEPGAFEAIKDARPDAIALVAYGAILKKPVLELPRLGCINAHASLLPRLRGAAPIQWAIANGDKVTGVTTMLMAEGLDSGDMLMRKEVGIEPDDTGGSLHDKLAPVAASLMVETLDALAAGTIKPEPQDESRATYAPMLKKDDGRIDWSMPAQVIERRVRAFDPWPGSFTDEAGGRLKVLNARALPRDLSIPPGTVSSCGKDGMLVSCGQGSLLITRVQPPGKRAMDCCDFLAGHCIEEGTRFL